MCICGACRASGEADAEAVRSAILLDELDFPGFGQPDSRGQIVVRHCARQHCALIKPIPRTLLLALLTFSVPP